MVFWKVVRSEKFLPLWPILEKRMNLKIRPFSNESSVSREFGRFLFKGMKFKFSPILNTDSYESRMNLGGTDDSWKSSIQPRFVRFRLNRLNLEKTDVLTRIILFSKKRPFGLIGSCYEQHQGVNAYSFFCVTAIQQDVMILERYVLEVWVRTSSARFQIRIPK
jgi:hypothetical protein